MLVSEYLNGLSFYNHLISTTIVVKEMFLVRVTKKLPPEPFKIAARVLSLSVPVIPAFIYAFTPDEKDVVLKWLKEDAFPHDIDESFIEHFKETNDTFSWGIEDKEFLFLQISEEEEFLLEDPPEWTKSYSEEIVAEMVSYQDRVRPEITYTSRYRRDESDDWPLLGLMAHEYIHSLQRQWGLEEDITGALSFTSSFFDSLIEEFADSWPKNEAESLRDSLIQVSQVALYALKELYCNWELRRFDLHEHLLQYLILLFSKSMKTPCVPPEFNIHFILGKNQQDLPSVTEAMSLALATIPNWISFIGFDKRAEKLRRIISNCYIGSIPIIAKELEHLFPLYLSMFEFSKKFSISYFTYIFIFFFDFAQGQSLAFTHVASVIESLQQLEERLGSYDLRWIFEPILKLGHLISLTDKWGKIPTTYREYLVSLMQERFSEEVFQEWLEQTRDFHPEDLAYLPLFGIFQLIRRLLLAGKQLEARTAIYVWQQLNEVRNHLDPTKKIEILDEINGYLENLLTKGFPSRRMYLPTFIRYETTLKNMLFEEQEAYGSPTESMKLIHLLTHFRIPLHNKIIDVAIQILDDVKYILGKEGLIGTNELPPEMREVLSIVILGNDNLRLPEFDRFLTIILQCVLLTLNIPLPEIRKIKQVFENIKHLETEMANENPNEDSPNETAPDS